MFRRLVEHLRGRTDVQNIDLMNLAGFCRNCLGNWMKDAADAKGVPLSKDESREAVYGMPYEEWKAKHQKEASPGSRRRSTRATSTDASRSRGLASVKQNKHADGSDGRGRDEVAVHGCG